MGQKIATKWSGIGVLGILLAARSLDRWLKAILCLTALASTGALAQVDINPSTVSGMELGKAIAMTTPHIVFGGGRVALSRKTEDMDFRPEVRQAIEDSIALRNKISEQENLSADQQWQFAWNIEGRTCNGKVVNPSWWGFTLRFDDCMAQELANRSQRQADLADLQLPFILKFPDAMARIKQALLTCAREINSANIKGGRKGVVVEISWVSWIWEIRPDSE